MAVKVRIEKKRPTLKAEDYAVPGDRSGRQTAYITFLVLSLFIIGIPTALALQDQRKWITAGVCIAWVIVPWWIYFVNLPRRYRSKIGLKNRAMPTHYPEIRDLVAQQCRIVGIKEPEVFIFQDEENGWIQTISGGRPYIVFTTKLLQMLKPKEFACAMLRELGRIKSGHARVRSLLHFLNKTPRFLRGLFAMPVWFLGYILWQNWEDDAEDTLDRLVLVLTRDARLCASTILKMEIEKNPVVNVSAEEVEDYLGQQDPIKASAVEVSAHFKMGTTVQQNPELFERLKGLIAVTQSKEYKELIGKMDEVLSSLKQTQTV